MRLRRAWLLDWEHDDGTAEAMAIIFADSEDEAESIVYEHHHNHRTNWMRGTVRHWVWEETSELAAWLLAVSPENKLPVLKRPA